MNINQVIILVLVIPLIIYSRETYPVHRNIVTTKFWVGEKSSFANHFIPNSSSAWDSRWEKHYGGVDNPKKRKEYWPGKFVPKENPFYCALPYNDLDKNGHRKNNAFKIVYWANDKKWMQNESMCKNSWVKIVFQNRTVYAQWEDVGPFGEDDAGYVFGKHQPATNKNENVGLDVSPAINDYLGIKGFSRTSWQFVNENEVPDGPWKKIITCSQVDFR